MDKRRGTLSSQNGSVRLAGPMSVSAGTSTPRDQRVDED
jgi:hypothetical protein